MNCNYIRTQDAETVQKLKNLGFVVLEQKGNIVTFLNDPTTIKKFMSSERLAVTFTNKREFG
jgi:hypothetical protein